MKISRSRIVAWGIALGIMALAVACGPLTSAAPPASGKPSLETTKPAAPADENPDVAAVRQAAAAFVAAFNQGDAKAIAALWTEDGEYIDEAGNAFTGRAAIEEEYASFFEQHPGAKLRMTIDSIKLLSGSAAIEDGRASLDPPPPGAPAGSKYTAIHVKSGDRWLMSSVRDSRTEAPSNFNHIADLEWLVGDWSAEEYGSRTKATCRWLPGKSFLERAFTVERPDKSTSSGVQIIGYNPLAGQIQSWTFGSDGGYAVGIWTPRENGWAVQQEGIMANGTISQAVNLWTRIDDNAYAWQSIRRTANSAALPDSDELVLKRKVSSSP